METNKTPNTAAQFTPTEYQQKLLYKMQHPVMYHLKQLGWSAVVCIGLAIVAGIAMSLFHFIGGMEWGNAGLACVATAVAVLCIYLLISFFKTGGEGKWVLRGFAILLTVLFVTAVVMYFCYIRPTYGA